MEQVLLNKKMSREFARAILPDIKIYIEQHKAEYQEFLRNEKIREAQINDNQKPK